eukprot:1483460-Heterocapsa_arctica.AAC.1
MVTRRRVALERLNQILLDSATANEAAENVDSAGGPPGGTAGAVHVSYAAEAEITRDLLDTRVVESTS